MVPQLEEVVVTEGIWVSARFATWPTYRGAAPPAGRDALAGGLLSNRWGGGRVACGLLR